MKKLSLAVFCGGVVAAALFGAFRVNNEGTPVPPASAEAPTDRGTTAADGTDRAFEPPKSRTITQHGIDGTINLDHDGRLVVDHDLRDLIGFFLSRANSEQDLPAVRTALLNHLESLDLPAETIAEIMATADLYIDYRVAAEQLQFGEDFSIDGIANRIETLHHLRREVLGQHIAEGFFAEEEAYDRFSLEFRRLMQDTSLTPEQRRQQSAALEEHMLPAAALKPQRRVEAIRKTQEEAQALLEQGASDADIYQLRAQRLGPEAAERLTKLDRERLEWQQRLGEYHRERDAIMSNEGLSEQDRQDAVERLTNEQFSEPERRRLRALASLNESS
ncbi:hypothetical protein CAI21_10855 [Alkalilimnicola ehrlichii]|uniref:Lipase chaperone n=1 Tax=Alkalilimnicola ehrlichii TaxID=351052 RepID=A0A3E0WT49_9GAMM|nr:lipase secretion chaperone [Alkalilimnicola ehrlichii]RFA29251.1 hypothetical protein CAI21_10855 [Alkalilimnicola ehrlichii]RFA36162.1 hypothetical protein CAL65_12000 [Alkalilimnicola ehrlichii]